MKVSSATSQYKLTAEPKPTASPSEKAKDTYGLKMAKYLWSEYHNQNSKMFYNQRNKYNENIAYAQGDQSIDRYKSLMKSDKTDDNSWLNIDWSVRNYASKRVNIIIDMLANEKLDLSLDAVDSFAIDEKKAFEYKQKAAIQLVDFTEKLNLFREENPFAEKAEFKTTQDLEMFMQNDYKHQFAMECEQANLAIMENNNFEQIKKQAAADMVYNGVGVVETVMGKNGYPEDRYVNPASLIVSNSEFEDFSDLSKGGYVKTVSFSEFQRRAGKQFSDKQYEEILANHSTKQSESHLYADAHNYDETYTSNENYSVRIMPFWFKSTIEDVYELKADDQGRKKMYKAKPDRGLGKGFVTKTNEYGVPYRTNGKSEVYRDKYEVLYTGVWIVNSDFMFDYGVKTNMSRDKKNLNKVCSPIHIIAPNMKHMKVVSIMDMMKPVLDDIQNYTNKLNQVIASAVPKGIYLDLDALENANMSGGGDKTLSPRELLQLYFSKGVVVGRGSDIAGNAANSRPIHELENGMSGDALSYLRLIESKRAELDELIGFNAIMSAGTPTRETGKAVSEMAAQQTNHAIGHLFRGMRQLYENVSKANIRHYQDMYRFMSHEQMREVLGSSSLKFMSGNKNVALSEFGYIVNVLPKTFEWRELYEQLKPAVANGRLGADDLLAVQNTQNLKQAEMILKSRLKQKEEEASAAAQAQNEAEIAKAQQLSQLKIQEEAQLDEIRTANKIKIVYAEAEAKAGVIKTDRELELQNSVTRESMKHESKKTEIAAGSQARIDESWQTKDQKPPEKKEEKKQDNKN